MDKDASPETQVSLNSPDGRVYDDNQLQIREFLKQLIDQHDVWAMKLSTEDAGMPFGDIQERHRLFGDLLPLQLKIGGPEARNDIRTGVKIGCQSLIAPMVESPYALSNFINACRETLGEKKFEHVDLQINVETRQGAEQIEAILEADGASHLSQITVGRHDLCRSMDRKPNETPVMDATSRVVREAQQRDIRTSVGGRITPGDARMIAEEVEPDKINTRELGFTVRSPEQVEEAVRKILDFEVELLVHERTFYRDEDERLTDRITKLEGRKNR
jgi:hypothetical protein